MIHAIYYIHALCNTQHSKSFSVPVVLFFTIDEPYLAIMMCPTISMTYHCARSQEEIIKIEKEKVYFHED
jgi:hypothetical protein